MNQVGVRDSSSLAPALFLGLLAGLPVVPPVLENRLGGLCVTEHARSEYMHRLFVRRAPEHLEPPLEVSAALQQLIAPERALLLGGGFGA